MQMDSYPIVIDKWIRQKSKFSRIAGARDESYPVRTGSREQAAHNSFQVHGSGTGKATRCGVAGLAGQRANDERR